MSSWEIDKTTWSFDPKDWSESKESDGDWSAFEKSKADQRYNEGNLISNSDDPVWVIPESGVPITDTHTPCGYWNANPREPNPPLPIIPPYIADPEKIDHYSGMDIAWSPDFGSTQGRYVAVIPTYTDNYNNTYSYYDYIMYSDDGGYNWTFRDIPQFDHASYTSPDRIDYFDSTFIAYSSSYTWVSLDGGMTWSAKGEFFSGFSSLSTVGRMFYGNAMFVAPGRNNYIWGLNYSTDGLNWSFLPIPSSLDTVWCGIYLTGSFWLFGTSYGGGNAVWMSGIDLTSFTKLPDTDDPQQYSDDCIIPSDYTVMYVDGYGNTASGWEAACNGKDTIVYGRGYFTVSWTEWTAIEHFNPYKVRYSAASDLFIANLWTPQNLVYSPYYGYSYYPNIGISKMGYNWTFVTLDTSKINSFSLGYNHCVVLCKDHIEVADIEDND